MIAFPYFWLIQLIHKTGETWAQTEWIGQKQLEIWIVFSEAGKIFPEQSVLEMTIRHGYLIPGGFVPP